MANTETMTREQFYQFTMDNVVDYLPEEVVSREDFGLKFTDCKKATSSYKSLIITPQRTVTRTTNLDLFYDAYLNGECLKDILRSISKQLITPAPADIDLRNVTDWNIARTKLFICVYAVNKVKTTVYETIADDLALTVRIMVNRDRTGIASCVITEDILNAWGITKEELFDTAMAVSEKVNPVKVMSLVDALGFPESDECPALIVTDKINYSGASLFYEEVLDDIADKFDSDIWVLPSSIHEFICIPANIGNAKDLCRMVADINATTVEPADRLTDSVYYYDRDIKAFYRKEVI